MNIKSDYIIFDFKNDKTDYIENKEHNNKGKKFKHIKKDNYIFDYSSKKELTKNDDKHFINSFSNNISEKSLINTSNNIKQDKEKNTGDSHSILKLINKGYSHINNILKLKNTKNKIIFKNIKKKLSVKSTGQQTLSIKSNNFRNILKSLRNNSMSKVILRNDNMNSLESNHTNKNSFFLNDKEKTINISKLQCKGLTMSYRHLNSYNLNQKDINKRLGYLKKSKINKNISSSLISIEQYKKRNNQKIDFPKVSNGFNFNKKQTNFLLNNSLINLSKNIRKEKNIFSQILFYILNNNRDKIENKFEFKLHKPCNINISTLVEMSKKNV